jgi:excisionase family DNA binding protein
MVNPQAAENLAYRTAKVLPPILVTKHDAAELLSVSVRTVEKLILFGRLPVRKIGKRALIPYQSVVDLASRDLPRISTGNGEEQR